MPGYIPKSDLKAIHCAFRKDCAPVIRSLPEGLERFIINHDLEAHHTECFMSDNFNPDKFNVFEFSKMCSALDIEFKKIQVGDIIEYFEFNTRVSRTLTPLTEDLCWELYYSNPAGGDNVDYIVLNNTKIIDSEHASILVLNRNCTFAVVYFEGNLSDIFEAARLDDPLRSFQHEKTADTRLFELIKGHIRSIKKCPQDAERLDYEFFSHCHNDFVDLFDLPQYLKMESSEVLAC